MTRTDTRDSAERNARWITRRLEEAFFMVAGAALALPLILPFA